MKYPVKDLKPPKRIIKLLQQDDVDLVLLRDSMKKLGQLEPITHVGGVIVKGYRRWLAARQLGWETIEAHELEGDPEALRAIAQTRRTVYSKLDKKALLKDHLDRDPGVSAGRLAHALQWSLDEVELLVGVYELIDPLRLMYDSGDLLLSTVWHIARIKDESQEELANLRGDELLESAKRFHRELRGERRFKRGARIRARGMKSVRDELDNPTAVGKILIQEGCETAYEGWTAALKWVLMELS